MPDVLGKVLRPILDALGRIFILMIRGYQIVLSPIMGGQCKYYPSCSNYAIEAIRVHGPFKGVRLSAWRLMRCNPASHGGVDHVPPRHAHS